MKRLAVRVYADTSVFGGVFDDEFQEASRAFFEQVRQSRFALVASAVVRREIVEAPARVQAFFGSMLSLMEIVEVRGDAVHLQAGYLSAGIVSRKWAADALHVALATASGCSVIVSWNFAHIVHFGKIPLYNAVNALQGYGRIAIHSPMEVIRYEDQGL
jgi:predicted nucleic acid-binding protein